jgi:hypothetical protein
MGCCESKDDNYYYEFTNQGCNKVQTNWNKIFSYIAKKNKTNLTLLNNQQSTQ